MAQPPSGEGRKVAKNMLAGALSGATEIMIMYPTEYVKTQMQLQKRVGTERLYKNSWDCAKTIVRQRGYLALYRGLSSLLLGTVPKTTARFTVFSWLKRMMTDGTTKDLTMARSLAAGMLTGGIEATFIVTPVETMKTKLIHDQNSAQPRFKGLIHGIRTIVKEEGIGGVYRGLTPTCLKQMGNQGVRFTVVEQFRRFARGGDPDKTVAAWQQFSGGLLAGTISVLATQPFDVVKTQMQRVGLQRHTTTIVVARTLITEEGILSMWKGTAARLPRVALGQGVTFLAFDQYMRLLNIAV